ncbi:ring canal kelch homolog isoform X2 [Manihot esculenta]|uniref:Uncharacterized protein n=4 Tax=Manihot esculenta TaxID=3983 RepID=A0ACB7H7I7_MANES|nr:ring canal kelch homolog isoform X2 [Manihot esculenta]KAG8647813.1 hypothetical protein MANES_09G112000v8 [Manihot esculenta]KAG8647815.1 hypothetical protein MANES_09G112000v8 [Manihot esculenta]
MPPNIANSTTPARNLKKSQLGGVIFGCKNDTMKECLSEQLFGLPAAHFSYVKNIDPGLPLFLFNYSDRKLHGIFEAAGSGQMNVNPYGWIAGGSRKTLFPAQVQICVRLKCHPVSEAQFKPIIADNYYNRSHFWFELDHAQTSKLMSLLASFAVSPITSIYENTTQLRIMYQPASLPQKRDGGFETLASEVQNHSGWEIDSVDVSSCLDGMNRPLENQLDTDILEQDEENLVLKQLQELAPKHEPKDSSFTGYVEDSTARDDNCSEEKSAEGQMGLGFRNELSASTSSDDSQCSIAREIEELKAFKLEQTFKVQCLEQKLVDAEEQIQELKDRCMILESMSNPSMTHTNDTASDSFDDLYKDPNVRSIYLVGGYDGDSWLPSLDLYFPSQDVLKSLKPMSTVRSYASIAQLNDEIYIFGGGNGQTWYDTVESYNPANDQWTLRPSLTEKRGSLGGATLNNKIFAVGGGNGTECFSKVEMLDLYVGRWIPTRSMLQKRFALAAMELNGALYVTGGFDGSDYLKSAERFDPREHSWTRIASMNTRRGCHSLVVLNEKLYVVGGFDGTKMVSSTEIFDPRLCLWVDGVPMNQARGYSAAAVVDESIYVIGGVRSDEHIVDTVEHFKEGEGWQERNTRAISKRCFLSAIVL